MSIREAAQLLGVDLQTVRYMIREMDVPWGICIASKGKDSKRRHYIVYRQRLLQELGMAGGADDGRRE